MIKKLYPFLLIVATPVVLLLMANSSGSVGGKTGSIGDNGNTCTDCHGGTATSKFGWITTNVSAEGYLPGQTYTITATGTHAGVVKFGFELTVENNEGDKVGTLQLTEPTRTKFTNASQAVTHTAAGNVPAGNTSTWTMNWVAPSNVEGNVGIYASFNAANGNGNTSGDVIYKSSIFITEFIPQPALVSISPDQAEQGISFQAIISAENTTFGGIVPIVSLSLDANPFETIVATEVTIINNTTLQADFNLPVEATPGLWDLHVDEMTLDKSFTVLLFTGIEDQFAQVLKIYPNPADHQFFIDNANGAELFIYRTNGELVNRMMVMNEKQQVNISQLSNGLYLVKIQANGISRVEKLLVN